MSTATPPPSEPPSPAERHGQYLRQAAWTRALRNQLYRRANLLAAREVLDVGCGTGAVTSELPARTRGRVVGLDRDPAALAFAQQLGGPVEYRLGNAESLPFADGSCDVVLCHFLLLWTRDPAAVLREMRRVCRPGGFVVVSAEPDYGGRLDYPPELALGPLQARALQQEGADPYVGRRLRHLFKQAGLQADVGVYPCVWSLAQYRDEFAAEWHLLLRTAGRLHPPEELMELRDRDAAALDEGVRLAFLPVFYALAAVERPGGA